MKNKKAVKILFALLIMLFFVLISKSFNSVEAKTEPKLDWSKKVPLRST